jgi:flagellar biosynthetic protein FliS
MASLEYRRALTEHASVVGLVIALHDTLIGDLRRAAEAMEKNDIPTRCEQLVHGFKVLTQLEAMLDLSNGGETAKKIHRFYRHVRSQMLLAQFKLSPSILYSQIEAVLLVRESWQQVDAAETKPAAPAAQRYDSMPELMVEVPETDVQTSFSCSG